ncbi:MAG: RagB/SusD family nutrient uptake outer membrane protein [Saprospiraceae bacterium]|nr:RagB/SusD family nutrient uptake outer membrane protein [Saprospiraceae bacterium]
MKKVPLSAYWKFSLIMILIMGCSLDEEILDESTGAELLDQDDIALNLLASAYGSLTGIMGCCDVFALQEVTTDEIIIPARGLDWFDGGNWIKLHEHSWGDELGNIAGAWANLESRVAKANTALLLLSNQNLDISDEELRSMKAEIRFLRAYFRTLILDMFRQVPMRDEFDENYNIPPPVFEAQEAFDWIIQELEMILPDLKDHGEISYGRVSRQAAQSLLARLYLNSEVYTGTPQWQACLEACNTVINSGHFSLGSDYFQLFSYDNDQQNPEAIFVIRQSLESQNNVFYSPSFTLHYNQNFGMFKFTLNGFSTTENFYYAWDQDKDPSNGVTTSDNRFQDDRIQSSTGANLGFLVGPQFHPDGSPIEDSQLTRATGNFVQLDYTPEFSSLTQALQHEGVRVIKYNPDPQSSPFFIGRNDYMLIRYAEIWLMKAEAMFRLQQPGALEHFNELRELRGAPLISNLNDEVFLAERGYEFYWEGHRRTDMVRFGKFTSGIWKFKDQSDDFRNVFPIPRSALSINENLSQNPGY